MFLMGVFDKNKTRFWEKSKILKFRSIFKNFTKFSEFLD